MKKTDERCENWLVNIARAVFFIRKSKKLNERTSSSCLQLITKFKLDDELNCMVERNGQERCSGMKNNFSRIINGNRVTSMLI